MRKRKGIQKRERDKKEGGRREEREEGKDRREEDGEKRRGERKRMVHEQIEYPLPVVPTGQAPHELLDKKHSTRGSHPPFFTKQFRTSNTNYY